MKTLKRRRREYKTDYAKRIKLLKSGKPRVVFRRTNKYIIAQYVTSNEARDSVKFGVNSKQLLKYGWGEKNKGSLKSIPAAYLLGFLVGKKITKENLDTPIADFGMLRTIHKTKVYGFLKGLIDSGIDIKCDEKIFPSEEKIKGENLKQKIDIQKIKSEIDKL